MLVYKVNGYEYSREDFVNTLTDKIRDYWYDGIIEEDKQGFDMFVLKALQRTLYELERFGEVDTYGKFDFWVEERD